MGRLSDDKLDDLFRENLLGLEKDPSKDAWTLLSKDVKRKNFFTFGWKHFNVYQLSILLLLLLLSGIFYLSSSDSSSESGNGKNIPSVVSDTLVKDSSSSFKEIQLNASEITTSKSSSKNDRVLIRKQGKKTDTLAVTENKVLQKKDSSLTPVVPPASITNTEPLTPKETLKPKKIITIIKRDTLVIKDTVNIKKKRKTR